jgi:trimethylamine:corrinoid methyltransferase-like protein
MQLAVLSQEQTSRLHDASLWILEKVGVHLPHPDVRERFREAGASVDEATARVRIPEAVIERCLA